MNASIRYHIIPAAPEAHLFEVELSVERPDPQGQILSLPAWVPGSYMIRDFAKNIVWLRAFCDEEPLEVSKLDKQTWRCAPCGGTLTVRYQVYAWDLSVRSAHLDTTHGYFNGTSVFLGVHGQEQEPCGVEIAPPPGEHYRDWRVATTLPLDGAKQWGFGRYRAADYDELLDHPVEMGRFDLVEFEACGVPHAMALTGRHRADTGRLARDLTRICEYHIRLFGEPAPVQRYLFQVMITGDGYGGLEHRSSTSLLCSRNDLPRLGDEEVGEGYRSFLGLCSHEYFHTWNVKRIKPAAFIPYDLSREVHTTLLWAFEGFTAYYDDLALVRTGLISRASYLELLGQTITRVQRGSGRLKQPLADSSFDTWTKFYKQDENAPNAIVSYYTKGSLVALALDLQIRRGSGERQSLDDVMRALWQGHGLTGVGVDEQAIETLIGAVAGIDLEDFFDRALRGTDDLPLAELLEHCGVQFNLRPAEGGADKGGKPGSGDRRPRAVLGVRSGKARAGAKLLNVYDDGAAQRSGLSAGDVVIAVNGLKVGHDTLEKVCAGHEVGECLHLHAFRRDELLEFDAVLQAAPEDTCHLSFVEAAGPAQERLLDAWLGNAAP